MPKYSPVTRVITIEFRPVDNPRNGVEVVVTPEYAVVRSGDTIQWNVQGLPAKATVTVGNFTAFGEASNVKVISGNVKFRKPDGMKDEKLRLVRGAHTYELKKTDLGTYKYDVMVDGKIVYDPDIEIRGPRG